MSGFVVAVVGVVGVGVGVVVVVVVNANISICMLHLVLLSSVIHTNNNGNLKSAYPVAQSAEQA